MAVVGGRWCFLLSLFSQQGYYINISSSCSTDRQCASPSSLFLSKNMIKHDTSKWLLVCFPFLSLPSSLTKWWRAFVMLLLYTFSYLPFSLVVFFFYKFSNDSTPNKKKSSQGMKCAWHLVVVYNETRDIYYRRLFVGLEQSDHVDDDHKQCKSSKKLTLFS